MMKTMENKKAATFNVTLGGPLLVTGSFTICGPDGKKIEVEGPVELCRCGESSTKPICDGSHDTNGFCL